MERYYLKDMAGRRCYAVEYKWSQLELIMIPPLDPLLDRWSETPEPSPHLTALVWQRIALNDAKYRDSGFFAALKAWLGRPSFAFGFIATCVLVGLLFAEVRISYLQRERSDQLARSYLLLIDPLLNTTETETRS